MNPNSLATLRRCLATGLLVLAVAGLSPVWAGRSCDSSQTLKTEAMTRSLALAERTLNALNATGAKVVVLARAGQNLTEYGVRYSHLGFAYQQADGAGGTVWRVLHKLNQCGTAESAIYRQGLGDFFMDELWRYEAAWLVPRPEVQTRLLEVLQEERRAVQLHHKPYSMVSYPWSQRYQQSNQWAIETLAMAMSPDIGGAQPSRVRAQAWLQSMDYVPTTLHIGAFKRLGARVSAANVAFDDHPSEKRFSDRIETVTVDSVFVWMRRAGLSTGSVVSIR